MFPFAGAVPNVIVVPLAAYESCLWKTPSLNTIRLSSLVTLALSVNAVVLPFPVNSCLRNVEELPPPLPAIAPQPLAVYPSNLSSSELYLNTPSAAVGLCAVVPTGTSIPSV